VLPPVEVSAKRVPRPGDPLWIPTSARLLYPDDGSKPLMADLRVTSPLPLSADLRLYGLPVDQTARDYIWDHRIGGPTTAVFGTRTKINPDIMQAALHPFLMSRRYRDINGALELQPTSRSDHRPALSVSSDAIERRATLWMARGSGSSASRATVVTSVRQSDVVGPVKRAVRALSIIPDYLDSQTLATLRMGDHTIEGFFLHGRESGDWNDTADGLDGSVHEDTRQDVAILRYELRLPHASRLSGGVSWEADFVDSRHAFGTFDEQTRGHSRILNPRLALTTAQDAWTFWASELYVESDRGASSRNTSPDAGAEGRVLVGPLRVQPSLSVQHLRDESTILHGVTVTTHPGRTTMTAGYGTYADYFVFKDGIFGTVFDPGAAQQPQRALHCAATIQYEPERRWPFDIVRISGVRKDLDVDLWGARDAVRVVSWDCIVAKSGTPSWELACLSNDTRRSDGPLVGLIPLSLRSGISYDLVRTFSVSLEGNYRSGAIGEVRSPGPRRGERFRLDPSCYVNLALNQKVTLGTRPMNVTVTIFNALALAGGRAEITQDQYGRRYDAPCWANVRVRYDSW
jgi:hypothetical protein